MLRIASMITAIWSIFFLINAMDVKYDILGTHKAPFALSTLLIFIVLFVNPTPWQWTARLTVMHVFLHVAIAPFGPVEFRDFYLGDVITSMRTPFTDIYHSF
jgi:hypothetical protein